MSTNSMLNLIIFGAPGCGKGTQSDLIIHKYGLAHISTGDLLREEIARQTADGIKANRLISKGNLAPDAMVMRMLSEAVGRLNGTCKGIVFDGIPRTLSQAKVFEKYMDKVGKPTSVMIDIEVPEEELINRLISRGQVSGRSDDKIEVVKHRFEVYRKRTAPVKKYYQSINKYVSVDGVGTVEEVFERIEKVLSSL